MGSKLSLKYDQNRQKFELEAVEVMDPEEVKRLWKEGKSLGWIREEMLRRQRKQRNE